jgi:hypothetical protein
MVAMPVATFTDARTPGTLFSVRSTLLAQDAHVIPVTASSILRTCAGVSGSVVNVTGVLLDHCSWSGGGGSKFPEAHEPLS